MVNTTSKKRTIKNKTIKNYKNNKIDIVETFIDMLNTVKLYHWKTYSYASHQATDTLYKELNEYIDEFIEVYLGKDQSRIPNFSIKVNLVNNSSEETFKKKIYKYRSFLTNLNKIFDEKKDMDVLHIRDSILSNINQFMYLLTFKK